MFRRTVAKVKAWIFARPGRPRIQQSDDSIGEELPVGENLQFEDDQSADRGVLDKDSADEIVATWNLLNPP